MSNNDQVRQHPLDIDIRTLYRNREIYEDYPPFQREKVWSITMKRNLIDSILRGFYIPAILLYRRSEFMLGKRYWVIDGQQRLTAIFEFMEDKFATSKVKRSDEPHYKPVGADMRYSQFPQELRERFESFTLHFRIIEDVDPAILGIMYRRLQNQVSLTGAEKLFSYTSKATEQAVALVDHPLWSQIYVGKTNRKNTFQACLYIIMLELMGGYANLTTPRLKDLAVGDKDSQITDKVMQTINSRLDSACRVFTNIELHNMREVIPLYQSILFLEQADYNLKKSSDGCLTPWFIGIQLNALEVQRARFFNFYEQMTKSGKQREFWAEHLPIIFTIEGLFSLDTKRAFDQLDRIRAWNKQKGICPECHKPVKLSDVGHHIVEHTNGGKTTPENCALVHKECHIKIHSKRKQNGSQITLFD